MLRGIFDTIRGFDSTFNDEVDKKEDLFNIFNMIVWNLFPMVFQLMSMVFGYIRNKKIKRHKLIIKHKKTDKEGISFYTYD